jgi:cytochrome c peroxidase
MMRNDRLTTTHGDALSRRNRFSLLAGSVALLALAMAGCSPTQEVAQKPKEEAPNRPVAYKISYPAGLDPESANIPKDNALTEEKIQLGKKLYFEKSLSVDGSISCASCIVWC